jgi:hypothetical protein
LLWGKVALADPRIGMLCPLPTYIELMEDDTRGVESIPWLAVRYDEAPESMYHVSSVGSIVMLSRLLAAELDP